MKRWNTLLRENIKSYRTYREDRDYIPVEVHRKVHQDWIWGNRAWALHIADALLEKSFACVRTGRRKTRLQYKEKERGSLVPITKHCAYCTVSCLTGWMSEWERREGHKCSLSFGLENWMNGVTVLWTRSSWNVCLRMS